LKLAVVVVVAIVAAVSIGLIRTGEEGSAEAAIKAAAVAMRDPGIRFRFEGEFDSGSTTYLVEGSAVGHERVHYVETSNSGNRVTSEWLIVGRRAYLKRGDAWHRWPFNRERETVGTGESTCLSVGGDVAFVFQIADWLAACPKSWQPVGSERVDGVDTIRYRFGDGISVEAMVWIGSGDDLVRRFELESEFKDSSHSRVWTFSDYGDDIEIEEPREFEGPGERGQDFAVGEKVLITEGRFEGRTWVLRAWTEEPDRLCHEVRFRSDEDPDGFAGGGGSCGARPYEYVQGRRIGALGGGAHTDESTDGTVDKEVALVRIYFGRNVEEVKPVTHPDFDVAFYVLFHGYGDMPTKIEAIDSSGRVIDSSP
jgi:hypothetical protein